MWNSAQLSSLSCFGIPAICGYMTSTSQQLLGESTGCVPWTLLHPCLQLSQVSRLAILTVDRLSAHGVMAGCTLKLHAVFNDAQRGFNDFSIHQLQYNLSCWQSVAPTLTYFSKPFCLGFYIFGTCVSAGVSGGGACDLALAQSKTFLQKGQPLGRTRWAIQTSSSLVFHIFLRKI